MYFLFARLDLSGRLNRLDEMLGEKGEEFKKRVRVIYADLRADINDQLSKDIGDIQVETRASNKTKTCQVMNFVRLSSTLQPGLMLTGVLRGRWTL